MAEELTSRARTEACLERIAALNPRLNAFVCVTGAMAREAAAGADARRARGESRGALDGVPVALKDNIDLAGVPTSAGVGARRERIATRDAEVTRRLKEAGAVILGKLNMHEAAHGGTNANEAFGPCFNPHRAGHSPGGSSGGAGAAVATGLCAVAIGTDTLGSIRMPASFCGVAGFKPTHGLVSTDGVVPLSRTLDHVGPLAPRIADLAPILEALCDVRWQPDRTARLQGIRLGRLRDLEKHAGPALDPCVGEGYAAALEVLETLGAKIVDVSLDGFDALAARAAAIRLIEADLAQTYGEEAERDPGGLSRALHAAIASGRAADVKALAAAQAEVGKARRVAGRLFAQIQALVTPTTPCTAFPFGAEVPRTLVAFTAFANYAGAPSVSVPMGRSKAGLPMGLLITAAAGADGLALRIAAAYERAAALDMRPRDLPTQH